MDADPRGPHADRAAPGGAAGRRNRQDVPGRTGGGTRVHRRPSGVPSPRSGSLPTGGVEIGDIAAYLAAGANARRTRLDAQREPSRPSDDDDLEALRARARSRPWQRGRAVTERSTCSRSGRRCSRWSPPTASLSTATRFHGHPRRRGEQHVRGDWRAEGLRTAWVSRLGDDAAGDRIRDALGRDGVDLRGPAPTGPADRADAPRHRRGRAYRRPGPAASACGPATSGRPDREARAVLVTGITAMLGSGPPRRGAGVPERARGLRAVDPNLRPGLWGSGCVPRASSSRCSPRCDLVLGWRTGAAAPGGRGRRHGPR